MRPLRAVTYLAPGLPLELFELAARAIAGAVGRPVELVAQSRHSGPMRGHRDPFAGGEADLGFVCSPSYLYLSTKARPSVELVPAAFAFEDPRLGGRPAYFSELIVRRDHAAAGLEDLAGAVWGYNDPCSLSGYYGTRFRLHELRRNGTFFAREVPTGSHAASIRGVVEGGLDAAAIDSNVLRATLRGSPGLGAELRVVESLGPYPIQPVVLRRELAPELGGPVAAALLELAYPQDAPARLARLGVTGCAPVGPADYAEELELLRSIGQLDEEPA